MSVLTPDMKVFQYVQSGFVYAANNKVCDDRYSYSISAHTKDKGIDAIFAEGKRWVKNLMTLNSKSYAARYREPLEDDARFYKEDQHKTEAIQLLKYLQCIHYNIELSTIEKGYSEALEPCIKFELSEQDKKDFQILEFFINDLKDSIISQLEPYKNAKYSD